MVVVNALNEHSCPGLQRLEGLGSAAWKGREQMLNSSWPSSDTLRRQTVHMRKPLASIEAYCRYMRHDAGVACAARLAKTSPSLPSAMVQGFPGCHLPSESLARTRQPAKEAIRVLTCQGVGYLLLRRMPCGLWAFHDPETPTRGYLRDVNRDAATSLNLPVRAEASFCLGCR